MNRLHTPEQFKTRPTRIMMGVVGLVLAYLLLTRAFQTGSWGQYFGTVLLFSLSIRLVFRGVKNEK